MNILFKKIKAIGFDLDETLYAPNEEINERIRNEIAKRILQNKPDLGNIKNARNLYETNYKKWKSGSLTLKKLKLENPEQIMHECLSNANVINLIKEDPILTIILNKIKEKYELFLLTGSPSETSMEKIKKIGININIFNNLIFGNTFPEAKKIDSTMFQNFLKTSKYKPDEHVYIGDNLKTDILPAKSQGMKTIYLGNEIQEADYCIKDIYEIEKLFL
ncbi:MAG: HAD family hydrolase [Nanoarchaeota archaeon]|nr:HAD family hydrolase [Nanoarchaeota archaeon]